MTYLTREVKATKRGDGRKIERGHRGCRLAKAAFRTTCILADSRLTAPTLPSAQTGKNGSFRETMDASGAAVVRSNLADQVAATPTVNPCPNNAQGPKTISLRDFDGHLRIRGNAMRGHPDETFAVPDKEHHRACAQMVPEKAYNLLAQLLDRDVA